MLLPSHLIDRFERLDRTRHGSRLDDADEGTSEALTGFEEGRVGRDLASSFRCSDGVPWIEVVDEERLHGLVYSHKSGQSECTEDGRGTHLRGR